jgi:hypothetical protein
MILRILSRLPITTIGVMSRAGVTVGRDRFAGTLDQSKIPNPKSKIPLLEAA